MSRKGGYKIIDLKGLDFSSNMVIDGIHESIEDNYGKPLLFSGIVIDGVEKDDVFANVVVNGDGYDVTLYDEILHISNVDVVSKLTRKYLGETSNTTKNILFKNVNINNINKCVVRVSTENFSAFDFYFINYLKEIEMNSMGLSLSEDENGSIRVTKAVLSQRDNDLEFTGFDEEDNKIDYKQSASETWELYILE